MVNIRYHHIELFVVALLVASLKLKCTGRENDTRCFCSQDNAYAVCA